jgi:Mrp family chromosome partitioning ATPase
VRSGVSDKKLLAETMRQMEMIGVRILGFVFHDQDSSGKSYGKRYSRKYYKYYSSYDKKDKSNAK